MFFLTCISKNFSDRIDIASGKIKGRHLVETSEQ